VLTGFQQVEDNVAALRILEHEAQSGQSRRGSQKYLELAVTRTRWRHQLLEVTTAESALSPTKSLREPSPAAAW